MNRPSPSAAGARLRLLLVGVLLMLIGSVLAHLVQTSGGVRIADVRFIGTGGKAMSGLLHVPRNATAKNPAPGILAVHGYFNSRETQGDFAIEFARRGYVVLALDQMGHGYSDPPAFMNGFGGPDGLRYLRSLDIVDKQNIGLEGHSMGGWAVVNAAAAIPDGYKAMVLEGSSTGAPFAPEGTATFPRNVAVVFAKFDEFAATMWGVPFARDVPQSGKLWKLFDTQVAVQPGKLYGSVDEGTARILQQPGGTHPWNHLSQAAIGHAVDWFQRTLVGGTPRPASEQIWMWKELGTTIAFAGFVVLVLGLFELLLGLPYFQPLAGTPTSAVAARTIRWWFTLVFGAFLPALTLFPFMQVGASFLPASALWPQAFSNELMVWALLNAAVIAGLGLLPGSASPSSRPHFGRVVLLAMLTVAAGYIAVVLIDAFFQVDLRYWFIAYKPMGASQFGAFVAYALPFAVFFSIALRALHANLTVQSHSVATQYLVNMVALAGGFVIFLFVQYGLLFSGHGMLSFHMSDPLRTIVAINFVPLMCMVALIATFTYRRTGGHLPGALICALLVAWYIVVGQATQAGT